MPGDTYRMVYSRRLRSRTNGPALYRPLTHNMFALKRFFFKCSIKGMVSRELFG